MGNVRQKRKNRSSLPKVRPNKKPTLKVPLDKAISGRWNRKETLTQNYRRLGLVSRLRGPTGGVEKKLSDVPAANSTSGAAISTRTGKGGQLVDPLVILPSGSQITTTTIVPREVRVERDGKGGIVRVLDDTEDEATRRRRRRNPLGDPLNDILDDDDDDNSSLASGNENASSGVIDDDGLEATTSTDAMGASYPKDSIVPRLEALAAKQEAARLARPVVKTMHAREADWIGRLVAKHGHDYQAMFWDRKLNFLQLTVTQLRRRVEVWETCRVID